MQCLDRKTALDMADGRLPRDLERAAQGHLEDCAECTALLATIVFSQVDPASSETAPAVRLGDMSAVPTGTTIGRFVVEGQLGSGGMGAVYRARDPELQRHVAIKLLHAGRSDADSDRLLREAQATARLNHPNVVAIYDVGRHDDEIYIAMELVEGEDLRAWLKGSQHPWPAILGAFVEAGRGLEAAHAAGLVHRDFKPDNALRGTDGRVRVVDFGLARGIADAALGVSAATQAAPSGRSRTVTETGAIVGTPMYMSPEQRAGDPIDPRSDQFSFCVALYHALYRNHPFSEGTHVALPPPTESPVPKAVFPIVARGLAEDPDARWPSMTALLDALEAIDRPSRARPFAYLAIAAVLAAIIVTIALVASGGDGAAAASPAADSGEAAELRARVEQLEDEKRRAEAGRGFALGQVRYEAGDYFVAAAAFADAYSKWEHGAFAYNVAASYDRAGHCPNALAWFRRFGELAASAPERVEAHTRIEALTAECGNIPPSHAPGTELVDAPVPEDLAARIPAVAASRDALAEHPCVARQAALPARKTADLSEAERYRLLDWIGTLERACKR